MLQIKGWKVSPCGIPGFTRYEDERVPKVQVEGFLLVKEQWNWVTSRGKSKITKITEK